MGAKAARRTETERDVQQEVAMESRVPRVARRPAGRSRGWTPAQHMAWECSCLDDRQLRQIARGHARRGVKPDRYWLAIVAFYRARQAKLRAERRMAEIAAKALHG